jgi:hypothetical protein
MNKWAAICLGIMHDASRSCAATGVRGRVCQALEKSLPAHTKKVLSLRFHIQRTPLTHDEISGLAVVKSGLIT